MGSGRVWLVGVAAVAGGLVAGWVALGHGQDVGTAGPVVDVAIGWAFAGAGLTLARLRPRNRVGGVLVLVGVAWLGQLLRVADVPWLATVGWLVSALPLAGLVVLTLAFPSGRLASRSERWIGGLALVLAGPGQLAWLMLLPSFPTCDGCAPPPANELLVGGAPNVADAVEVAQNAAGALLGLAALVLLVRRWWSGSPALRRQAAPVLWLGASLCLVGAVALVDGIAGGPLGDGPWWALSGLVALVPLTVVYALVRRRLDRAHVASLVIELGAGRSTASLPESLARTLRDPGLDVLYWLPTQGRYVDRAGRPAALPEPRLRSKVPTSNVEASGSRRSSTIPSSTRPRSSSHPGLRGCCARARERAAAGRLRSRATRTMRASRARLVEVGDRERRRLERDLHDGAQQRLVSIAMTLGLARARERAGGEVSSLLGEAQEELERALADLRELSHGLLPPILRERGLEPALRELAKRSAVRTDLSVDPLPALTPAVEATAYFVASEALTNAAKHAAAGRVELTLRQEAGGVRVQIADDGLGGADPSGSGLRGLADRVGALGGRLEVGAGPSGGTVVEAWVPCGSS
ncbi:MAG: histidine kinase [Thermoleophilia bacterium]